MNTFLFSIDLEDIRFRMENGGKYLERTPIMISKILEWLDKRRVKCTFFTVGDIAENYPEIIQELDNKGHEIACHSYRHITLDKLNQEEFKKDLYQNIEALLKAGAAAPIGYRAPNFSFTSDKKWVYSVMKDAGIRYSSSVLPANNPLYGWEKFGESNKEIDGVLEIPISLGKFLTKKIPFAGGIYFRVLPFVWVKKQFNIAAGSPNPIVSYMHPYDFDTEQEKFMHPGINNSKFYNKLMYYNRKNLFNRLDAILKQTKITTFKYWLEDKNGQLSI